MYLTYYMISLKISQLFFRESINKKKFKVKNKDPTT